MPEPVWEIDAEIPIEKAAGNLWEVAAEVPVEGLPRPVQTGDPAMSTGMTTDALAGDAERGWASEGEVTPEQKIALDKIKEYAALGMHLGTEVVAGLVQPWLAPLQGTGFDTNAELAKWSKYFKEHAGEAQAYYPDIVLRKETEPGKDVPGRLDIPFTDLNIGVEKRPVMDLAGETARGLGFVAGPVRVAGKAAGLVTEAALPAATPGIAKAVARGAGTGALLGEGDPEKTAETAITFALFDLFGHVLPKAGKAVKSVPEKISKSNWWRELTIKERGLVVQEIGQQIQGMREAGKTDGEILRTIKQAYGSESPEFGKAWEEIAVQSGRVPGKEAPIRTKGAVEVPVEEARGPAAKAFKEPGKTPEDVLAEFDTDMDTLMERVGEGSIQAKGAVEVPVKEAKAPEPKMPDEIFKGGAGSPERQAAVNNLIEAQRQKLQKNISDGKCVSLEEVEAFRGEPWADKLLPPVLEEQKPLSEDEILAAHTASLQSIIDKKPESKFDARNIFIARVRRQMGLTGEETQDLFLRDEFINILPQLDAAFTRGEDIVALADDFTKALSKKMGKASQDQKKLEKRKEPWEMTLDELFKTQVQKNEKKISTLVQEQDVLLKKVPKVRKGNLTRKTKFDSGGLIQGEKWLNSPAGKRTIFLSEQIQRLRDLNKKFEKREKVDEIKEQHKKYIKKALSEGKPVPRAVLEEYAGEEWADRALGKPLKGVLDEQGTGEQEAPGVSGKPGLEEHEGPGAGRPAVERKAPKAEKGGGVAIEHPKGSEQAVYAVMELSDVQASHLPLQSFQKNPLYSFENERQYQTNQAEQEKVLERALAKEFKPSFLVTESVDAVHGGPVVDKYGHVLAGNSRKMILDRVYANSPGAAKAYGDELVERAEQYGLDPDKVKEFSQPVLVRQLLREDYTDQEIGKLVHGFNQDFKQALDSKTEGVSKAKFISDKSFKILGAGLAEHDTLPQYLTTASARELVDSLIEDGALEKTQKGKYIVNGELNKEGRGFIATVLRGFALKDYDLVNSLPESLLNLTDRILPSMAKSMARGGEWDIVPAYCDALRLCLDFSRSKHETLEAYLGTRNLMGRNDALKENPDVQALVYAIKNMKPTEFERAWRAYANQAMMTQGGKTVLPGMEPKKPEAMRVFKTKATPEGVFGRAVAFRKGGEGTGPGKIGAKQVEEWVRPLAEQAVNAKPWKVIESMDEAPARVKRKYQRTKGVVSGFYDFDTQTVYLVADGIADQGAAAGAWIKESAAAWKHEQGHGALADMYKHVFGEKAGARLEKDLEALARDFPEMMRGLADDYGADLSKDKDRIEMATEALIVTSEKMEAGEKLSAGEKGLWQRFKDWVLRLLRDLGLRRMKPAEVQDIARDLVGFYTKGPKPAETLAGLEDMALKDLIAKAGDLGVLGKSRARQVLIEDIQGAGVVFRKKSKAVKFKDKETEARFQEARKG
ncbi:MAG: hypothetical protein SVS15_04660, partial [Thermodesulfobacteriota bacterium]|nr:hypothetical protein [Thermodesulfobacteriota bacterium]